VTGEEPGLKLVDWPHILSVCARSGDGGGSGGGGSGECFCPLSAKLGRRDSADDGRTEENTSPFFSHPLFSLAFRHPLAQSAEKFLNEEEESGWRR
jgi:hypothetical protein